MSPLPFSQFWRELCDLHPDLTTPNEGRKTPRATCMRDLRYDSAFVVGGGKISLREKARGEE